MTCRERLKLEHPEYVDDQNTLDSYAGGCCGCPDDHGYLDPPEFCMNKDISMEERCRRRWDRTVPENKKEPEFAYEHTGTPIAKVTSIDISDDGTLLINLDDTNNEKETTRVMTHNVFNKLLDELDGNSLDTLKTKNAKYSSSDDSLHNFRSGAEIMGGTPAQCAWGYMTKHLTALRDKIEKNDFSDRDDLLEKCQDIINYIRFIWVIGNDEEMNKH